MNWTEIPGSKIRFTSILLMATELLIIKVGGTHHRGALSFATVC